MEEENHEEEDYSINSDSSLSEFDFVDHDSEDENDSNYITPLMPVKIILVCCKYEIRASTTRYTQ